MITMGSPVASSVSGPGTAETKAICAIRGPVEGGALEGQRGIRVRYLGQEADARAVGVRDVKAALAVHPAREREQPAVGRPGGPPSSASLPTRVASPEGRVAR